MRWLCLGLVCVGLVACGGSASQSASAFIVENFNQVIAGQSGKQWDTLLPAQQQLVPHDLYETCAPQINASHVVATATYADAITAQPVGHLDATAVTVSYTYLGQQHFATVHAVQVAGHWRWILADDALAAYQAGHCPA